ncbi:MAG: DUF3329 domain-containing protein [Gammaproteobacteria bacterium]|nr:DUF3329 domain-containing protein [Gammaproteobacteria bacterium]
MSKIWQTEKTALLFSAIWIILIGTVFSNWTLAFALPLTAYIVWIYSRLFQLEKWLARGTKTNEIFDDNGFIGIINSHLYQQRKVHNKRKKRTKEILRRLNTNISALPDATVLLNQRFEIEWSNDPAKYLLGLSRADTGQRINNLIRNPEFQSYLLHPSNRPNLEIKSPIDLITDLQIKIVRFGKNQRLLIIRNISDQKQLQEALKHFVANASHELKTPLTAIIGHLEMLEMDQQLSTPARHSVAILQQQSQRMKQLIQDLLLLSRIESYQLQADEGDTIEIPQLMSEVMLGVNKDCNRENIDCDFPQTPFLLGIKSEIQGICTNLIENAIKHNPEHTAVEVSWRLNPAGEFVFKVIDHGEGISETELPYLTDRYYRGSDTTARQVSGSGLGLAIVQQAALKHGAKLEIDSQLNKGSTFSVIFPLYRVIQQATPKA